MSKTASSRKATRAGTNDESGDQSKAPTNRSGDQRKAPTEMDDGSTKSNLYDMPL